MAGRGRFHGEQDLPEGLAERLEAYVALVRAWASRLDLVAPGDLGRLETRHISDSLRVLPLLDAAPEGPAVDVGSGAGLPGVPLALARPQRHFRLLEPRQRRAAFLEETVRTLELDAEVLGMSAEQAAGDERLRGRHAFATARALAPPRRAFQLLEPLVAAGGIRVVFVGTGEIPPEAEDWGGGIAKIGPEGRSQENPG